MMAYRGNFREIFKKKVQNQNKTGLNTPRKSHLITRSYIPTYEMSLEIEIEIFREYKNWSIT